MHRSVCDLEMVGWLVPVARYAGLAEWLPAWNWNGDVHRDTEPYLHWNALCESHWVSRSMDQSNIQQIVRAYVWFKRRNQVQSGAIFCSIADCPSCLISYLRCIRYICAPLLHHSDVCFFLVVRQQNKLPRETYGIVGMIANFVSCITMLWRACDYF